MTRVIAESPFIHMKTGWKKPQTPCARFPARSNFKQSCIQFAASASRITRRTVRILSSFLSLLGSVKRRHRLSSEADIEWANERFSVRRQKTGALFFVPIYPDLRPLLERMKQRAAEFNQTGECSRSRMPRMPIRC